MSLFPRQPHGLTACLLAGLLVATVSACAVGGAATARDAAPASTPASTPAPVSNVVTARSAVASLTVRGRGPRTGYSRAEFGPAWADVDRNGCDTRNDVLRRDLREVTIRPGTNGCVVLAGVLAEPYTGKTVTFSKDRADAVQIDHVVALSDAWQKGAAQWSAERRLQLANDPLNLLAVDGPTNQAKGDGDTATWLPPAKGYRCRYVARQVAVKRAYDLGITAAERDAMLRVLAACPDEPLPGAGTSTPARDEPAAPTPTTAAAGRDPDYGTCANARTHGAGPYHRGEVEYGYYRDADHDGTVCEP